MSPFLLGVSAAAFLLALALGGPVVRLLSRARLRQSIQAELPEGHQAKAGTPTMGAIIFLVPLALVLLSVPGGAMWTVYAGLMLGVMAACGALGLVDDLRVMEGRPRRAGLPIRVFLLVLLTLSALVVLLVDRYASLSVVYVPFIGSVFLGPWGLPLAALTMWATINGVAITDGMDGLLASTAAVAFAAYGIVAWSQGNSPLSAFCFTLVGALLGFLWYNAYPAQVFMGNLGSLALGSGLAMAALLTGQWLLLPIIGIVFLAEGLSDLLQIGYFRITGGKRLFRMAPLHHHFELLGWSEPQVTTRFALVGVAGALVGLALALA